MQKRVISLALLFAAACCGAADSGIEGRTSAAPIQRAYDRLYNFDFPGAHRILNRYIAVNPEEPLPYAVRAAAYLFHELDRLRILESEFFTDDRRIKDKKNLKPDPVLKQKLLDAVAAAEQRAGAVLSAKPSDLNALFTLSMTKGILTDYTSFVERRHLAALSYAKQSQEEALRLLAAAPDFYDAYLTTGLSEYLVGSLPFFVRWFVRFDEVDGSKEQAVRNLELASRKARYLGPFAKILLAVIHLREKRPKESERLLAELSRDYPENPLFRRELARLSHELAE